MKEKVLITGAGGFIGSRLVEMIESQDMEVVKLDHKVLGLPEVLERVMTEVKPSIVFHLAAYGNQHHQKDWAEVIRANYLGTYNLLWASKDLELKAFVNTGSSSEYGTKMTQMKETDLPETKTIYGATKVGATFLGRAFAQEFDLPVVNIRPFSVYGPQEAETRFIPSVIRCALTGDSLSLSDGVHDWIFVDDFIRGMILVTESVDRLKGDVINIGTGTQYSNTQVVEIVEKLTGASIKVNRVDKLRDFDTTLSWVADSTKLRLLGWNPQESLESGIAKVIYAKRNR